MAIPNLIELTKSKEYEEEINKKYLEDQEWDKAFLTYYNFLITDFVQFIKDTQEKIEQGKIPKYRAEDLGNTELKIPVTKKYWKEITNLITENGLGKGRCYSKPYMGIVTFHGTSLHKLSIDFYNELQRIERILKSPEEMKKELESFVENNAKWLEKKKTENIKKSVFSIIEDEHYELYFLFLKEFYKAITLYQETEKAKRGEILTIPFNYKSTNILRDTCINNFLSFYEIGYINNNGAGEFHGTIEEFRTAYFQEMQRLEYLGAKKTLKLN